MNTCADCGVSHHWRNCPEFEESIFEHEDPEWVEPEIVELEDELDVVEDREIRRQMLARYEELRGTSLAP